MVHLTKFSCPYRSMMQCASYKLLGVQDLDVLQASDQWGTAVISVVCKALRSLHAG